MQQECSCGDSCPICEKCDSPQCECYCEFEAETETEPEGEDEEDTMDW